ncbi:MAG TPA: UbiA family prenyltransferase [Pyrinomonadaceae bacterium]|jgi:4-hydroxybenzoate polyprenyltransferase
MFKQLGRYLLYMLRIRRVEFRVAEIPILLIPILLLVRDTSILKTFAFWEGVFIFFLLFAFGDMINCLADRDLDAVYKPHLSEAVYGLGVPFVTFQVAATAFAAIGLAIHLSFTLDRWLIPVLVVFGLILGAAYSVKPVQLKGRGLWQLICLWLIIFVGPMLFVGLLVNAAFSAEIIVFAAAFGTLQMGIILVNTAEDYPEDSAAGIKTTIVTLGLQKGITLAFGLVAGGALGVVITLAMLFWQRNIEFRGTLSLLPAIAACVYVIKSLWKLKLLVTDAKLAESIQTVKQAAKKVPLWITLAAWSVLLATYSLFYFSR